MKTDMNIVFLNGKFVKSEDAKISVFDQGFLYGDGIYESFRSVDDKLYQFSKHYERLIKSANALNYNLTYSESELETILLELRKRNNLKNAYYRLTISFDCLTK